MKEYISKHVGEILDVVALSLVAGSMYYLMHNHKFEKMLENQKTYSTYSAKQWHDSLTNSFNLERLVK